MTITIGLLKIKEIWINPGIHLSYILANVVSVIIIGFIIAFKKRPLNFSYIFQCRLKKTEIHFLRSLSVFELYGKTRV